GVGRRCTTGCNCGPARALPHGPPVGCRFFDGSVTGCRYKPPHFVTHRRTTTWLVPALSLAFCAAASAQPSSTALTLSGWPAAPQSERSIAATAVGIRFTAPATADLASVHLAWRRNIGDCQ